MLFDLRSRGRRGTVRVIYLGLAILFGAGLVLFGVGAGFGGGGILTSLTGNEGSSGSSFASEIKKYKKLTAQQPDNASAWEKLTDAQLHEAGNEAYVGRNGGVTSKGKELYAQVAQSWGHYIALNPPQPNSELAERMVSVFDEEGLNEPAAAVRVLQIVVAARPESYALFAKLAEYAYKAHNPGVGDLAAAKAVSLAPAASRSLLKTELDKIKANPSGAESSSGATVPTTTTTPAPSTSKKK